MRYTITTHDNGTMTVEMGGVSYVVTEAHFGFDGPNGEPTALLNHVVGGAPKADEHPHSHTAGAPNGFEYLSGGRD